MPWGNQFRQALRSVRRRPSLSLTIIITLALGIGANTSIYSVVHGVLFTALPNTKTVRARGAAVPKQRWSTPQASVAMPIDGDSKRSSSSGASS